MGKNIIQNFIQWIFRQKQRRKVIFPVKDYIILEIPEDAKTMIVRPQSHDPIKIGTTELVVWRVGPDCKAVKPGDRLVFNPEAAVQIPFEGRQYYLTREEAVGCIVREEKSHATN